MIINKKTVLILFYVFIFILTSGCSQASVTPLVKMGFCLDTMVRVTLYDCTDEAVADGALALCAGYEDIFSPTKPESELVRLNESAGKPFEVSEDLAAVIGTAIRLGEISAGAFDVSINPVSSLYDFKSEDTVPPSADDINKALEYVNYRYIILDGNTVTIPSGMSLTLGGIAKGYIADRIAEYLVEQDVGSAIIDLGGNIYTLGGRPDGTDFRIGVRNPEGETGDYLGIIPACNLSVVTSGVYERYFEYGGKVYHHLLDPETGLPVRNGLASVTVVNSSSMIADGLSTAVFILGRERGTALIEGMEDTGAVFIFDDGRIETVGKVMFNPAND